MQRSTFKVLFYVKRQSEKSGQVPIMGRITINGTMSQFSCKLTVRSSLWDAKANKASGKSLEAQRINEKLENIKTNIGKQYQRLCDRDSYVTAEKVRNAFLGTGDDCRLLLQTFDECLERANGDRAYSKHNDYRKRQVTNALSDSMKSGGFVPASCSARPDRDMTATGSPPKVSSRNASKSSDATVRRCGPSPACRSRHGLALPCQFVAIYTRATFGSAVRIA